MKSRIRNARIRLGFTQLQLGERIGRTSSYLSKIETGKIIPPDEVIDSIATNLFVSAEWLKEGNGIIPIIDHRSIGERIKMIRIKNNLSQKEFAQLIHVSRNTISLVETQKIASSRAVINAVVSQFNVDEEWLRTGRGEMYSHKITEIIEYLKTHPDAENQIKKWLATRDK